MPDESNEPGIAARAADGLTDAKRTVDAASEEVADVSRRIKAAINSPEFPKSILGLVEDITRAAPFAMLGIAFIAGAMFGAKRRR